MTKGWYGVDLIGLTISYSTFLLARHKRVPELGLFQDLSVEELTRVLVPLIEESVKRHIGALALRLGPKLERGEGSHKLETVPNQTDNDPCCLHTNTGTLSQHHLRPGSRVGAGDGKLEEAFHQTLNTWGLETVKNENHQENFLSMGFKKTTLQDYFLGKYCIFFRPCSDTKSDV